MIVTAAFVHVSVATVPVIVGADGFSNGATTAVLYVVVSVVSSVVSAVAFVGSEENE